jgi:maltooligosyltrehalose trehalohydrolase
VAQFPGRRNWGYDGVGVYAVQNSYGGPDGLREFVDACHARSLAVVLDVVYNHFGPEGNYLNELGDYFTDRYNIFWGDAINYDGPSSDDVRRFFIENALMWIRDYHIDALRLDAVHAIFDQSAHHFLQELGERVHGEAQRLNRRIYLIAESDLNAPRIVRPVDQGGYGLDAQWDDDFHHALHSALTREAGGYYSDYAEVSKFAKCYRTAYALTGEYSAFRRRSHGAPPVGLHGEKFVVCAQNHDQIGNRATGDRLSTLTTFEGLKLAAGAVLLSPFIPMLFMGEEYGETRPFLYFVDHSDPNLLAQVADTRLREFADSDWQGDPPDPTSPDTFERSRLDRSLAQSSMNAVLRNLYRELIRLRKETPALISLRLDMVDVTQPAEKTIVVKRWSGNDIAVIAMNFDESEAPVNIAEGEWAIALDTADTRWAGPGSGVMSGGIITLRPQSLVLLTSAAR